MNLRCALKMQARHFSPPPPPTSPPASAAATKRPRSKPPPRRSLASSFSLADGWDPQPLLPHSELSLPLTLPTGQTFRWRRGSRSDSFTGVVAGHVVTLAHLPPSRQVFFQLHNPGPAATLSSSRAVLSDYLNARISLSKMWSRFSDVDERFREVVGSFDGGGARILRQDPVECLFQFLCSSNNNIKRIEKMVGVLERYGECMGSVDGVEYFDFPTVEMLGEVSEEELREKGFGYRAKYIVGTVKALLAKPDGGAKWLASLRGMDLPDVTDALCTFPGVGPKVAACIALFSLNQHQAVPVDTHVWKIATRYIMPELAGKSLTLKLSNAVAEAFVAKFGDYAGWAQNVLFIGELSSLKVGPHSVSTVTETKTIKRKHKMTNVCAESPLSSA